MPVDVEFEYFLCFCISAVPDGSDRRPDSAVDRAYHQQLHEAPLQHGAQQDSGTPLKARSESSVYLS